MQIPQKNSSRYLLMLPSDYTIRVSSRAKRIRFRLSAQTGLEVVVPQGFDLKRIPEIVAQEQKWITKTQQRLRNQLPTVSDPGLPERIRLLAVDQEWRVEYQGASERLTYREAAGGVVCAGK